MQLTKFWASQIEDYVIDLAWSPDGARLAAAAGSGPISLFSASAGKREADLPGHAMGTNAIAWRPAGAILASGGQDGAVKLWDAAAGRHFASHQVGKDWVEHVAWRPCADVSTLALAAVAGKQLVFLNPDGSLRHRCPEAPKTISALAWHPAGGCAATAHFGGVLLWDADDYLIQREIPYGNGIQALVWSPDGRWLVSGNQDPSVHLWIPDEDMELQMSGYEGKVRHLSFDRSSRWLATSGGSDACVWDCSGAGPEGREPVMLPHEAPVGALAYQWRKGLLATAAQDGTVMLWSPDRRQPLRATIRTPGAVSRIAWSADDSLLAIGSDAGHVWVIRCEA